MKKIRQSVTSNQKTGAEYKEYDSTTYHCETDDVWMNVEQPSAVKVNKYEANQQPTQG
jgi:hypothetical protein